MPEVGTASQSGSGAAGGAPPNPPRERSFLPFLHLSREDALSPCSETPVGEKLGALRREGLWAQVPVLTPAAQAPVGWFRIIPQTHAGGRPFPRRLCWKVLTGPAGCVSWKISYPLADQAGFAQRLRARCGGQWAGWSRGRPGGRDAGRTGRPGPGSRPGAPRTPGSSANPAEPGGLGNPGRAGPGRPGDKMAAGPNGLQEWVGSAYLFVESSLDKVVLSDAYSHPQQKVAVYRALRTVLAESGSPEVLQMLKIHRSDQQLIVQLRFCGRQTCARFLRAYREGALRTTLEGCLARALTLRSVPLQLELRAGGELLDALMTDEERCLSCIFAQKPDRLRDEELAELEDALQNLTCSSGGQGGNVEVAPSPLQSLVSSPSVEKPPPPPSGQTFLFQGQPVVNRPLSLQDQQTFARSVGLKWRKVGRSLQRGCRALRDPVLDSLAYEYEREGLYEQAFQLLRRFIQAEGRRATLQRLVEALEENELTSLAEDLLGLTSPDGSLA